MRAFLELDAIESQQAVIIFTDTIVAVEPYQRNASTAAPRWGSRILTNTHVWFRVKQRPAVICSLLRDSGQNVRLEADKKDDA